MIYFIQNTSFPYGMAAARRRLCYSKGLIESGEKVTVLVCQKVFNIGKGDDMPECGEYKGVSYEYLVGKYKRKIKIFRALDWYLLDYFFSFFKLIRKIAKDDVMYVYLYPILLQFVLVLVAKMRGAKLVKEICEHPDALRDMSSLSAKIGSWIERRLLMPRYDGFICISKNLERFVHEYGLPTSKTIIVPILVDDESVDANYVGVESPYTVPYIVHTGTMHEQKDSISKILRGFAKFLCNTNSDCRLVFTGPQANENCQYIPLMKELGIEDHVDLLGMVDMQQVIKLQHFAAMTIIYKSNNLQTVNCFPTKLGEFLLSETPVITTRVGESQEYLTDGVNAFLFDENDDDRLAYLIQYIIENPQIAGEVASAGRKVALSSFNPIFHGRRLCEFFHQV